MINEDSGKNDLDEHGQRRTGLSRKAYELGLQQLEYPNDQQNKLLMQFGNGRYKRKSAEKDKPKDIKPTRSSAFCHRGKLECITRRVCSGGGLRTQVSLSSMVRIFALNAWKVKGFCRKHKGSSAIPCRHTASSA